MASCYGIIRNCIIWGNLAASGPQISGSPFATYCCIQDWSGGGEGNIALNPQFVDPNDHAATYDDNNYRLKPDSPCIDAGFNNPDLLDTDIAGMHRIMFGGKSPTVDIGAWEYYVNILSRGLNGDAVLTWSSLAGKSYRVEQSSDMLTWETAVENVPSLGDTTTTWTDLQVSSMVKFYRVEMK